MHQSTSRPHLKHLEQCFLADLEPLKGLFFLYHSLAQSLQVPKLSAGYWPGNSKHVQIVKCVMVQCHNVSVIVKQFLTLLCNYVLKEVFILAQQCKIIYTAIHS